MRGFRYYSFITIGLIWLFQASCATHGTAQDESPASGPPPDYPAEIKKADDLFAQRDEGIDKLRQSVKILKSIRKPDQRNFEVEWKYARSCFFLGKRTDDAKEKEESFDEGREAGKIASRIEPEKPDGYFWYGANLGEQAKLSPLTVGLSKVDDIRQAMQKVIEIQPDYQAGSAFDALAEIEMATNLVGGSPEKAIEYLEKGIKHEKDNTYLQLHLGKAYLAVDRDAEAKKQLEYVINMKPSPGYRAEYDECVAEAKKLLRTRF